MRHVLLDTVGPIAVWDEDDQWHAAAATAFGNVVRERSVLITTTFVLAECANAAARQSCRSAVVDLRHALESRGQIIAPAENEWQEAGRTMPPITRAGRVWWINCPSS